MRGGGPEDLGLDTIMGMDVKKQINFRIIYRGPIHGEDVTAFVKNPDVDGVLMTQCDFTDILEALRAIVHS
jgi:hypothetical protein